MPIFATLQEAVGQIKDYDYIWSNAFLSLANPIQLQTALGERVRRTHSPRNLTFCCPAGFGDWDKNSPNEDFVRFGAVKSVVMGHFASTPTTAQKVINGEIEGYNLPLGVMSKMIRSAASGENYLISDVGLNLFVDPLYGEYRLNKRSKENYLEDIIIDGKRRLKYRIPPMDIAFIKGSSADADGNISFEKECVVSDARTLAQAVHLRGGKVIVQVERIIQNRQHPWNVVVPAPFVDMIVVCPDQTQIAGIDEYSPAYSGDKFYGSDLIREIIINKEEKSPSKDIARAAIAKRAVRELKAGQIANIGIGIPEMVVMEAAKNGLLDCISLSVESGSIKGAPASGQAFGAVTGAHSICSTSQMFDLYDGGGLDICFLGALEIDADGNVNSHMSEGKLSGIGGFANISQNTPQVVFCVTFSSGGIQIEEKNGLMTIQKEGSFLKFVDKVRSVSFSAANARNAKQKVLYVTERGVFQLGTQGLELIEITPGIDLKKNILDLIPFEVKIAESICR
jgi:propionate CoA-transferase